MQKGKGNGQFKINLKTEACHCWSASSSFSFVFRLCHYYVGFFFSVFTVSAGAFNYKRTKKGCPSLTEVNTTCLAQSAIFNMKTEQSKLIL
jgi:hypothetical protein